MIRAIIFDLDGVLCHTDALHCKAWKQACAIYGFTFTEECNDLLRGVSRMDCVDIILSKQTAVPRNFDKVEFATEKNMIYRSLLGHIGKDEMDGRVPDMLRRLKAMGLKLAVGSSSRNAPLILDTLHIASLFDAVVDGSILTKSKPSPEVFIRAAERIGVRCDEAVVVEDAEAGIQAAKAGGFFTVSIGLSSGETNLESVIDLVDIEVLKQ